MGILEVKNVNKRFGGLQALGDVNLSVARTARSTRSSAPTARASPPAQLPGRQADPDTGSVMFDGKSVLGRKPFEINQMGISRVFQTPEIFGDLTVLENMMIPMLCQARRRLPDACHRKHRNEKVSSSSAEDMLEVNMADKRDFTAAIAVTRRQAAAGDRPCASRRSRACCCSMNPPPAWRGPTPTTPSTCSSKSTKRDITIAIIEHDMHVVFSLAERITVLAQGTPLVEDTPKTSRAIRRCAKRIWEKRHERGR
jgi:branched-chain amino acid transport system ATP-binding protein